MIPASASSTLSSLDGLEVTLNGEPAVISERDEPFLHRTVVVTSLVSESTAVWSWSNAVGVVENGGSFRA